MLGVIVGEFKLLIPNSTWRWTIWLAAAAGLFSMCLAFFTMPADHRPTSHAKQAANGPEALTSRSLQLLTALCTSLIYGLLYMLLLMYPMSFELDRRWPFAYSSLPFLAIIGGMFFGCGRLVQEARSTHPARQLSSMCSGSLVLSFAMFMFASTSSRESHAWPQVSSGAFIGYAVCTLAAVQTCNTKTSRSSRLLRPRISI